MDTEAPGDDENLPMNKLKLKGDGLIDPESGYSKMFKNKMESRRTFYKMLTLLVLVLAVLIIAVYGLSLAYQKMPEVLKGTCTTEDCLRSATILVESMNKSVDPCEDFYQFACGNFAKLHRIPKSASSNSWYEEVHEKNLVLIRDFMERDDSDNEFSSVSKSRRLYRSCMATDKMNANGIKQLVQILGEIDLLSTVNSNRRSLSTILASIKKTINLDYLFDTKVEANTKNRSTNRISLCKPSGINIFPYKKVTENNNKTSSRKFRETVETKKIAGIENDRGDEDGDDDYFKSYKKYVSGVIGEICSFNYCNMNNTSLKTEHISQLLRFNEEYSKIKDAIYDSDMELPLVMTVDKLQKYTNSITRIITKTNEKIIDWKQYLTILFMDVENVTLDFETDLIQISNIKYFEALFELISKHKDQILFNIYWEVIYTLLPYTTNEMRFIQDRYDYETTGLEKNPSKSLHCADAVNSMMGMAVARLLLDIEPLNNNMKMVAEMMKNIHWAFEKIVKELDWMDDTTKQRTLYKAQQMKTLIGFPEFINDSVQLDEYYSEFEVIENDYFSNVIHYVQQDLNKSLKSLRKLNNYTIIDSWATDPLVVNAFNLYQANAISVPAGILQFPFFGHNLQALNYGFLGVTLGHELTHGFDNTGRKFDHEGNENKWWTDQSIAEYEKLTNCFIHHYESYVVPVIEKKIHGKNTLNENIADNGGLREALLAYRKFLNDNGEEPKLPGLEQYSSEQIFYLAFANDGCEAATKDSLFNDLLDEHSPNKIRVNAVLNNSFEFSQVWNCKQGSKMNSENEKCKIW